MTLKQKGRKNTPNINTEQEQSLISIETNKENYAFVNNNKVTLNNEEKARLEKMVVIGFGWIILI